MQTTTINTTLTRLYVHNPTFSLHTTAAASSPFTSHLSRLHSNTNSVWHYRNRIFLLRSHHTTHSLLSHFAHPTFTLHSHSSSISVLLLTCCNHLIDLPKYFSHFRHLHCSIFFFIWRLMFYFPLDTFIFFYEESYGTQCIHLSLIRSFWVTSFCVESLIYILFQCINLKQGIIVSVE